jgi:hypothetical protein
VAGLFSLLVPLLSGFVPMQVDARTAATMLLPHLERLVCGWRRRLCCATDER